MSRRSTRRSYVGISSWQVDIYVEVCMKYKGTLLVVKDCNRALKLHRDLFGFQHLQDNDENMELTNNLYLQELGYWK